MRCIGRMSYAGILTNHFEEQAAETLLKEVAAATAIQNGEIKIAKHRWGSIIATNISPLTVSSFLELDLDKRNIFISKLRALKGETEVFKSFERTLGNKNKPLLVYLSGEINKQSGGAIAVNVAMVSFMAVLANLLINNGNTVLSQGAITEALEQNAPGEWGKFLTTSIGFTPEESTVFSVLGNPTYTREYTSGTRFLEQQEKVTHTTAQLASAEIVTANALPNAASTLFEMNNQLSGSILNALNTQTALTSELQSARAKYTATQAILSQSENWWSSSARESAVSNAASAQKTLEGIQSRLVGHIDTTVIANVFAQLGDATWESFEETRQAHIRAERLATVEEGRLSREQNALARKAASLAHDNALKFAAPSPAPAAFANAPSAAAVAAQKRVEAARLEAAARAPGPMTEIETLRAVEARGPYALRATEIRLAAAAATSEAEAAVTRQMASDLAAGKVVFNKGKGQIRFGVHAFNSTLPKNASTSKTDFLKLSGLEDLMKTARKDGERDGSKIKGKFDSNYGVEHAPIIGNPATIFRKATDKLGLTTAEEKSSLQTFAQLVILNEYSIGFEEKAQGKLELLRRGINQAEGDAAGKDYSAVKVTLKAALVKNGKIVVPDGKGGTKELTDPEIDNLVKEIVEMAIGVGKMPKPDKIDAFAMEIRTQLRGKGKLDETRRSWFLRAERNARKSPVEILSDNILLLTVVLTLFGGVAIVGAAFENPMKNAMARAANKQGAAAAEATLLQAKAAARESNARAEHQRALTAAAKAQAAALLKVTEAEAASKIARLAANNATNAEGRTKAKENAAAAEKTLREAKAAKAAADEKLQALKPNASANRLQRRRSVLEERGEMPGMEREENDEEATLKAELEASKARQAAAKATANAAAKAVADEAASNAAANAAAALRSSRAAAAAEPPKEPSEAEKRRQRAEAAVKRLGQGGGTRRSRIYRSRTRRHR
jgi:hypothetical protein